MIDDLIQNNGGPKNKFSDNTIINKNTERKITLATFYNPDMQLFKDETEAFRKKVGEDNIIKDWYTCNVSQIAIPPKFIGGQVEIATVVMSVAIFRYYATQ